MSDEQSKEKHSRRIQTKESAIVKQTKIAKSMGHDVREPHRLVKHHVFDCGVPNCPMCSSPRKLYKEETLQEKSFKQKKLHDEEYGED